MLLLGCNEAVEVKTSIAHQPELKIEDFSVDKNELDLNQLEGRWYYKNEPFNGLATAYHSNGQIAESVGFIDGKREGVAHYWFDNSQIKKQCYYVSNKLHGTVKCWWSNGVQNLESHYVHGVRHGIQSRWYNNGQLARKTTIVNGMEEGLQQAWLQNGKIYVNYEARNGRVFGLKKANLCYELEDENLKVKEVVAKINALAAINTEISDAEIDALLSEAEQEVALHRIYNTSTNLVDADALLADVESDLDASFRDRIFKVLKEGYSDVRTAVAKRND